MSIEIFVDTKLTKEAKHQRLKAQIESLVSGKRI